MSKISEYISRYKSGTSKYICPAGKNKFYACANYNDVDDDQTSISSNPKPVCQVKTYTQTYLQ